MQRSYTTDIHTQQTLITTNIGRNKLNIYTQQTFKAEDIDRNKLNIHTQ